MQRGMIDSIQPVPRKKGSEAQLNGKISLKR
jgi:hypothetical protein